MGKYSKAFKKITPFKYPHCKHEVTQQPQKYTNYQSYKSFLKKEFDGKCVYCCKVDNALEDKSSFHVEHYRPKSLFPHLATEYSNLLYSCAACNRYKSSYWADKANKRVLNPYSHVMNQYVVFEKDKVAGKDEQGEFFIRLLHLNDEESIKYRQLLGSMIAKLIKSISIIDVDSNLVVKEREINESISILSRLIGKDPEMIKKALRISTFV